MRVLLFFLFVLVEGREPQCKNVPSAGEIFMQNFQTWVVNPILNAPLAVRMKRTSPSAKCPPVRVGELSTYESVGVLFKMFSGGHDLWATDYTCVLNACAEWEFGGFSTASPFADRECTAATQVARAAVLQLPLIVFCALVGIAVLSFFILMVVAFSH
jgi:hypothetical protein